MLTKAVCFHFLPVQSQPRSDWDQPRGMRGKGISHWFLWAERGVEFYTSPDRGNYSLQKQSQGVFPLSWCHFCTWVSSHLRRRIMFVQNVCHHTGLKLKEVLTVQEKKSVRKNQNRPAGLSAATGLSTTDCALCIWAAKPPSLLLGWNTAEQKPPCLPRLVYLHLNHLLLT